MLSRLDDAVHLQPALGPAAASLRALLGALRAVVVRLPPGVPDLKAAAARLHGGVPALTGEPISDGARLLVDLRVMCASLREEAGGRGTDTFGALSAVEAALRAGRPRVDADVLARAATAGDWDEVLAAAPQLDVDEYALVAALDYAVRPTLRAAAARVTALIADARWERGACPACGAPPLLAELRGKDEGRVLRCGRCASAWSFPRVGCVACGERDHRRLGALHEEGEEDYRRAEYCEQCRRYLKTVAVLDPLTPDGVIEEDLATAALDLAAVERGYHR
jgi:FdhE protein